MANLWSLDNFYDLLELSQNAAPVIGLTAEIEVEERKIALLHDEDVAAFKKVRDMADYIFKENMEDHSSQRAD